MKFDVKNKTAVILAVIVVCALAIMVGMYFLDSEGDKKAAAKATESIDMLRNGEYSEFYANAADELREEMTESELMEEWGLLTDIIGPVESIERTSVYDDGRYTVVDSYCIFEKGAMIIKLAFDSHDRIAGMLMQSYFPEKLPAGLEEKDVKLNEGTKWELNGKMTYAPGSKSDTVVIIVHGSGPSDMDGTVGAKKMYRDLAWGLADRGVDTFRYDKRTYVYGTESAGDISRLTVKEETIDDAIAAAQLMRDQGYTNVVLLGHSMGGMLAPRIITESNGLFDGFVSLAGSPRTLTDIGADQNWNLYKDTPNAPEMRQYIDIELQKARQVSTWPEERVMSNTIFGMPAYYIRDLNGTSAGDLARNMDIPMLFLQGSADVQVFADKDFSAWKSILANNPNAEFKLYDGLSHMFMESTGKYAGTPYESLIMDHVRPYVLDDIADFVGSSFGSAPAETVYQTSFYDGSSLGSAMA